MPILSSTLASLGPTGPAIALALGRPAVFAAFLATAWTLGRTLSWRLAFDGFLEKAGLAVALGAATLAEGVQLLGLAGILRPWALAAVAVAIHLLGWRAWREALAAARARWRGRHPGGRWALVLALTALATAPLFALTLYPATDFDPTAYHLPLARAFSATGRLPFLTDLIFPIGPQLNDLLFAAVFPWGAELAAQGVELALTLATAALLAGWGARAFSPAAGWIAAGLYLGNPLVVHLAGTAYIDPGLALFVTAALYSWDRARGDAAGALGWLATAGFLAGAAASTKYLGLFFVGVVVSIAGFAVPARGWRAMAWTGMAALAALAPAYGRILLATGNPLFPFLPGLFGSSAWDPQPWLGGISWGRRLADLATLPWDVIFRRATVNRQPPLSPAYLVGIPWLIAGARRDVRTRWLLGVALAWLLVFSLLPRDARYLLLVLPVVTLVLAGAIAKLAGLPAQGRRTAATALAVALFLPGWGYALYRLARQGPIPVTAQGRERYLAGRLPLYPALRFLNRTRGHDWVAFGFHAQNMEYFADGRLLGNWNGPAPFHRLLPLVARPAAFHRALRDLGVSVLLVFPEGGVALPEGAPGFRALFRPLYADARARMYLLVR